MKTSSQPPRPALSALAQTWRFKKDPMGFIGQVRAECGEIFSLRLLGMGRWVVIASPEILQELYKKPEDEVVAGEIRGRMLGAMVGDRASIAIDGEEYARRRRITTPFFSGRAVFERTGDIRRAAEEGLARFPVGETFPIQPYFDEVSLAVTCRILYGGGNRPETERLKRLSRTFLTALKPPSVQVESLRINLGRWTPWGRFVKAKRELFEALEKEVRARGSSDAAESGGDSDLTAALIGEYGTGDDSAVETIVHELAAFVIGGAETTSKAMSWTLAGVLAHPEAARRLRTELEEVLGDEPLAAKHLRQLPYLHAVMQEGLRHNAAGPFAGFRWTLKDIELGGYAVSEGTILAQGFSETGKQDVFPDRDAFEPANFLDRKVKMSDWVPFGGGTRMCTGMGLAQLELAVVIATVVRYADLELVERAPRAVPSGIAFAPAGGLPVRVVAKRPVPAA